MQHNKSREEDEGGGRRTLRGLDFEPRHKSRRLIWGLKGLQREDEDDEGKNDDEDEVEDDVEGDKHEGEKKRGI